MAVKGQMFPITVLTVASSEQRLVIDSVMLFFKIKTHLSPTKRTQALIVLAGYREMSTLNKGNESVALLFLRCRLRDIAVNKG